MVLERVTVPPTVKTDTSVSNMENVEKVRNVFPETWLWSNRSVG